MNEEFESAKTKYLAYRREQQKNTLEEGLGFTRKDIIKGIVSVASLVAFALISLVVVYNLREGGDAPRLDVITVGSFFGGFGVAMIFNTVHMWIMMWRMKGWLQADDIKHMNAHIDTLEANNRHFEQIAKEARDGQ